MKKVLKMLKNKNAQELFFIVATVLVFSVCAILPWLSMPKSHSTPEQPVVEITPERRNELFLAYWEGEDSNYRELPRPEIDDVDLTVFHDRVDELWDYFVIDPKSGKAVESGETYFALRDTHGGEIRVANLWKRWTGDWQNWFNLCMDIDTGEVYYFYASAICENTDKDYRFDLRPYLGADELAETWGEIQNRACIYVDWSGSSTDPANAIYVDEDEVFQYQVECKYYPSTMLDIKFTVR